MRPHSAHFSQQPVENHELWSHDSEMPLSPGLQLEEVALEDVFQMHIKSKRHNLDEVRERWKTSNKWHPAVLPNISGQEHRTAQAAEHHSGVEAEKVKMRRIVQSLKKELNIRNHPDPSITCGGTWQKDASISATYF